MTDQADGPPPSSAARPPLKGPAAYRAAGVDTEAAASLVDRIKPRVAATQRSGVMGGLGGFGALFDLAATGYADPLLVAGTDGVGTKLKIAIEADDHARIGIDLVAMCVNDLVVQGAEPLFFLDYFATGRLEVGTAEQVIAGIAEGCAAAGCALIGGETAEMPGMYADGHYDLAGFAVGAVERDRLLPAAALAEGDVLLGLASDGLHSNGFSLVRRIVADEGLAWDAPAPFDPEHRLGEALLTPTRLYVKPLLSVLHGRPGAIRGLCHVTGGGFPENVPRMLSDGLAAAIDVRAWTPAPVFRWLAAAGGVSPEDMAGTFNCGIGMVMAVAPEAAAAVAAGLAEAGETVHQLGHVVPTAETGGAGVVLNGLDTGWLAES